jgi:hypothetical protein
LLVKQSEGVELEMDSTAATLLERIDTIARELEELRKAVWLQTQLPEKNLANRLYGALGQGSWDEYDLELDWQRFSS